ncbi:MAG TPA: potassium-transporting ATPase subunit KdpA, partial [Gemmatimonadaceae bacterium]|nr:potassium-transporting ATPase subunit KdpA [Gemmatimonadaceae bacterium]
MTANGWIQILFYCVVLLAVTKPMGIYMLKVYDGSYRWLRVVERPIYRVCGIDEGEDQHWTGYAAGVLMFSVVTMLVTYIALRL